MPDPATSFLVALGIEPFAFVAALGLALAATALVAVVHDGLTKRHAWATRMLLVLVVVLAGAAFRGTARRHGSPATSDVLHAQAR